jgi:hypothetical protein
VSTCDVAAIHEALATRLRTLSGWNVSPYPTDLITPPMLVVEPDSDWLDPWGAMAHGAPSMRVVVRAYASLTNVDAGFGKIAELVSVRPSSDAAKTETIFYCLEQEPTLGGIVAQCVARNKPVQPSYGMADGVRYVTVEIPVLILAPVS